MQKYKFLIPLLILVLTTLACGFNFNFQVPELDTIETGATETEDFVVPEPDSPGTPELEIAFGAGKIVLEPGGEQGLAEGTATYNVSELAPLIFQEGNRVRLQQGDGEFRGIPNFNNNLVMEWEVRLVDTPMELILNGGANQFSAELGGLSLTDLTINQGAADSRFTFSELNKVEMDTLEASAGAANLSLVGLANANVTDEIIFQGGAGNYTLDFGGDLQQNLEVRIEAGLGNIILVIPEGVPATITLEGALNEVNADAGWQKTGDVYTQEGEGFSIEIDVTLGAGNLAIQN